MKKFTFLFLGIFCSLGCFAHPEPESVFASANIHGHECYIVTCNSQMKEDFVANISDDCDGLKVSDVLKKFGLDSSSVNSISNNIKKRNVIIYLYDVEGDTVATLVIDQAVCTFASPGDIGVNELPQSN